MTPERAIHILKPLGVRPENISAETVRTHNQLSGTWRVVARVDDYERTLTQTTSPFSAARWLNRYTTLFNSDPSVASI